MTLSKTEEGRRVGKSADEEGLFKPPFLLHELLTRKSSFFLKKKGFRRKQSVYTCICGILE